jgi:hypothetical protein
MQLILPRWLLWMLCGLLLGFVFLIYADQARSHEWWRNKECRFQTLDKGTWTAREEWLTARCATSKWAVPGGLVEFDAIAQCESGWNRFASNGGSYVGLFQHAASSYVGRVHAYEPASWEKGLSDRWTNSRGQIVMSARMMAAVGLSPWACA